MSCYKNPITQNCIKETSNAAKTIHACKPLEKCGNRKVINPATGNCVRRSSVVGRISMVCPSITKKGISPQRFNEVLNEVEMLRRRSPTGPLRTEINRLKQEIEDLRRAPPKAASLPKSPKKTAPKMSPKSAPAPKQVSPPKTPTTEPERSMYILKTKYKLEKGPLARLIYEWNEDKRILLDINAYRKSRNLSPKVPYTLLEFYEQREKKNTQAVQPKIVPKGLGGPCNAPKKLSGPPDPQYNLYFNKSNLAQAKRILRELPDTLKGYIREFNGTSDKEYNLRVYFEEELEKVQGLIEKAEGYIQTMNEGSDTQQMYTKENLYNVIMCLSELEKITKLVAEKGEAPAKPKKLNAGPNLALAALFAKRQ